MPVSKFKIDKQALDRARGFLGITQPVRVWIGNTWCAGRYVGVGLGREGLFHRVALNARLNPVGAEETIWHELEHVRQGQAYRNHKEFELAWLGQLIDAGLEDSLLNPTLTDAELLRYAEMPFERLADAAADLRPPEIQVTVPR